VSLLLDLMKKGFLAGVGALTMTKERAEELVEEMVKRGEITRSEAAQTIQELMDKGKEQQETIKKSVREEIDKARNDFGFVTKKDYEQLENRVKELEEKLNKG